MSELYLLSYRYRQMNIAPSPDIETISKQFETLTLQPSNILSEISAAQRAVQKLPAAQFWCVAARFFFKEQSEWPSKGLVSFSRKKIAPIVFLNIDILYQDLSFYIKKLYQLGINLNKWQKELPTPFHLAAVTQKSLFIETAELSVIDKVDAKGRTALHLAAFFGHHEIATKLVALGAKTTLCIPFYGSLLSMAILGKNKNTISFFKEIEEKQPKASGDALILDSEITVKSSLLYCAKDYRYSGSLKTKRFEEKIKTSSNPKLLKEYHEQEKNRKALYHSWKINWNICVDDSEIKHKIIYNHDGNHIEFEPIRGGHSKFFLHKMAKSTDQFAKLFANDPAYDRNCLSILQDALDFASNIDSFKHSTIRERILSHKFTILPISAPGHSIEAVICGDILVIGNRGKWSRKSIELFHFDNSLLSEAILRNMLKNFSTGEEYLTFFFTTLKEKLKLQKLPMEMELEQWMILLNQLIGNCAWESAETAGYIIFVLHALQKKGLLNIRKFTAAEALPVVFSCDYQFHNWLLFQQLEHLEKYLKITTEPNRQFISNREMYPEITQLFREKKHSKLTHPYLFNQMCSIEKQHPEFTAFYRFLAK